MPPANDTSGDLADWASAHTQAELYVRLKQSDAHLMRAIEDALARINGGSFSVCESCKQPISKARLEASLVGHESSRRHETTDFLEDLTA